MVFFKRTILAYQKDAVVDIYWLYYCLYYKTKTHHFDKFLKFGFPRVHYKSKTLKQVN